MEGHLVETTPWYRLTQVVPALQHTNLNLLEYERVCLAHALRRADGNVIQAAELLGIGKSTMYRKLDIVGLKPIAPREHRGEDGNHQQGVTGAA